MLLSIGEIIDKLVIENIKISNLKEKLNSKNDLSHEDRVMMHQKMMSLNKNRSILINSVDEKIDLVRQNKEQNRTLNAVKTYG